MHAPAFEFVTSLAAELSTGTVELPGFPQVVERVRRALADPAHTAAQTAQMIGAEPALAAKVLAIANSAAFTCAGKPVTELRKAVLRLGDNLLRSTALSFAMAQLRHQSTLRSIEPRPQSLWKQSPNVAAICYGLARRASLARMRPFSWVCCTE